MSRRRRPLLAVLALLLFLIPGAMAESWDDRLHVESTGAEGTLVLGEVLESVQRTYPPLLAARVERELAEAALIEARGGFDTRLKGSGLAAPTEFYDRYTGNLGIEQPTRLWGSRLFAGYRVGRGDFPSYLGGDKTNESGELRAGIEIPLLKDGAVDARRTKLRTAELGRQAADPRIEIQRIEMMRSASEAYWSWVARGRNVDVQRELLETAEDRRNQYERRAARGAIPRIEVRDNERLIVDRKIRLRGAKRDALEAAITLSLFLRDDEEEPVIPDRERLPRDFPDERIWGEEKLAQDIERALRSHPILRELELERSELEARLALDRNALLPDLRLEIEGSKDFGTSSSGIDTSGRLSNDPKDDTAVKARLRLDVPVLQRAARGRVQSTRAELIRLGHRAGFARDQIGASIRRAMASLEAAYDQTRLARERRDLSLELRNAEERKLELGSSNLIDVNIREIQAADAASDLIFAQTAYFQALARYKEAIAASGL